MNFTVVSSLLLFVLVGAHTSTTPTPTRTTPAATTAAATTGAAGAKPKTQVYMNWNLRVGPIDLEEVMAGGRLQQPAATGTAPATSTVPSAVKPSAAPSSVPSTVPSTAPTNAARPTPTPTTAGKKPKYTPPAGKLYRAKDDPSIRDLLFLGSPAENAKFEAEAATLYAARGDTSDPKVAERRAWFKQEKQRRREILNKRNAKPTQTASTKQAAPATQATPTPTKAVPTPTQAAALKPVISAATQGAKGLVSKFAGMFSKKAEEGKKKLLNRKRK